MPKFALKIKCELENVASFRWEQNNQWCFTVTNADTSESCEAYLCKDDELELAGSRGTAHFIKKWPGEQSQSYLKIIDVKKVTGATEYTAENNGEEVVILAVEARGLVPTEWTCKNDFTVTTTGGTTFEEVDVEDGIWADYDAENDCPVSIQELSGRFEPC